MIDTVGLFFMKKSFQIQEKEKTFPKENFCEK